MVKYEKEFKEQAVKMAEEVGPTKAAQDLGIPANTLYTWISKSRKHGGRAHVGSGHRRQRATNDETAELIKRNRELEKAN